MTRLAHAGLVPAIACSSAFVLATGCGITNPRQAKAPAATAPPIVIEVLTDEDARDLGACGCAFYPRGQQGSDVNPVIGWLDGRTREAPLRFDGETQLLGPVEERDDARRGPDDMPRVGDRTTYLLGNEHTRATLACRISETCWEDESCEGIGYACDLEVESGGRRGEREVEGYCGC
jgi:hypothetical protein